jgi:uncharacterized protein (DUF1697 family)
MPQYISLLRGINVGKSKRISKEELIKLHESLGFKNAQTFIQSGNVVFETSISSNKKISDLISKSFQENYGFDVPVVVLTSKELEKVLKKNPYQKEAVKDASKALIGFLSSQPDPAKLRSMNALKSPPNIFKADSSALYLFCPEGVGRAKLPNFEKTLGVGITFRNARVSEQILQIASDKKNEQGEK